MTAQFCVDKKQTRRDRLRRQNWLLQQKAIRVTGAAVCPAVELESSNKYSAVGLNYEYVASTVICRTCCSIPFKCETNLP